LQSIGPQDAEQVLYHGISSGIDHGDLLSVSPKPQLLISTTNDYFSIQGARETADEVYRIYQAYNRPNDFSMSEDLAGHASTRKNREALAFFQQQLNNPGPSGDTEVEYLSETDMRVTVTGQVVPELNGETVFSLNRKDAEKMLKNRKLSSGKSNRTSSEIICTAKYLSGYSEPETPSGRVLTGKIQREGYRIEKYFVTGESDYPIPYLLMVPENPNGKGILWLHPCGKAANASAGAEMERMVKQGFTLLAPDLIGTGETGRVTLPVIPKLTMFPIISGLLPC
jgi:hypothetical protein